jgi:hypothetical protein
VHSEFLQKISPSQSKEAVTIKREQEKTIKFSGESLGRWVFAATMLTN